MNFDVQAVTAPPNLIKALRSGFDAITNHMGLILLPMALDLFLWFGPHLGVKKLLESLLQQISSFTVTDGGETQEALQMSQAYWAATEITALKARPISTNRCQRNYGSG